MIRESKYIIRRVIIGVLIALILSFINSCEVHAETLNVSENSKFNNSNLPVWYEINPYRNILFLYEDWRLFSGDPYNVNFGYIDICLYGDVTVNNNSADCSDGCINNINLYDTGLNCSINYTGQVNVSGKRYFIFFNIKEWSLKNSDTLPYFQDYLTFERTTGYNPIIDFNMVYLSNEDLYVQYASNNKIQDLIEQSNQTIENSTQDIIDNQNSNTQDIINNQNSNTDKEIESQQVCTNYNYNYNNMPIDYYDKYLNGSGNFVDDVGSRVSKYINVSKGDYIYISGSTTASGAYCLYDENKTLLNCHTYIQGTQTIQVSNNGFIRLSIWKSLNLTFKGKYCKNGNQAMNDSINETNDTLKDNTIDDPSGEFRDFQDMLPENGVITELITLPISLFTNILNSINGTCSAFVLGELMGTNLTIPCINISEYLGSFLWNVIDILFSGIFVYTISKKMIQVFENMTSMRESDDLE